MRKAGEVSPTRNKTKSKILRRNDSAPRVMFRAEKMERHIRLIADHPTVVTGADVKQIASPHFVVAPDLHLAGGATGHNHADMFHFAETRAARCAHVRRPFP